MKIPDENNEIYYTVLEAVALVKENKPDFRLEAIVRRTDFSFLVFGYWEFKREWVTWSFNAEDGGFYGGSYAPGVAKDEAVKTFLYRVGEVMAPTKL